MNDVKKCTLMKHGVYYFKDRLMGPCCYNKSGKINQNYEIDPVHCARCVDEEAAGLYSYRQGANKRFGFDHNGKSILSLEITPTINCNLTCKICNEESSTSWAKLKRIPINTSTNLKPSELDSLLLQYDLSNLDTINFSGGEPLLNNNIFKYIKEISEKIDLSNTTLRFSTNGTIKINEKIFSLFEKFKLVSARFSLDDVEAGHEYHRFPSKWDDWIEVWTHFLENSPVNVMPSINRTISILNVNRLHLLNEWHQQYATSRLGDPIELLDHYCAGELALENITTQVKQAMLDMYGDKSIQWKHIEHLPTKTNIQDTLNYINSMDQYHNQSFKEYDPVMYQLLFTRPSSVPPTSA